MLLVNLLLMCSMSLGTGTFLPQYVAPEWVNQCRVCNATEQRDFGGLLSPCCEEPSEPIGSCWCGVRKTNRIVGGAEAGVNEFPWQVRVLVICGTVANVM